MRLFLAPTILLTAALTAVTAQELSPPPDSTATDTLIVRMMDGIGDAYPGRESGILADSQWCWSDIRTVPEAFAMIPGVYQFELGGEGKPVHMWFLGTGDEHVAVDGILTDTELFSSNAVTMYPLELVRSIEELRGPQALFTGARWNLRSHQHASAKPLTAVRFVQSPNETIFSDGYFSQNIARSTNLHVGFQRRTSNGRFDNSGLDSWSVRGRLRYNVTPWLNLMGTWRYEKTSNGQNGGIDRARTTTIFDEVSAVVTEPDAYDLRTQTVLSFHAMADLLGDSLSLTRLTLSSADQEREFYRIAATPYEPAVRDFAISGRFGTRLEQSVRFPWFTVRGMGEVATHTTLDSTILRDIRRTRKTFGASIETGLLPIVTPSITVRTDGTPEGSRTSIATGIDLRPLESLTLYVYTEQWSHFPDLRETVWNDSLVRYPSQRAIGTDRFTTIGVRWDFMKASYLTVEGFDREQTDRLFYMRDTTTSGTPAIAGRYEDVAIRGLRVAGHVALGSFYLSGWLTSMSVDGRAMIAEMHPSVWARWEGGWRDRLFGDELGLQVTLRGSFFDRYAGFSSDPRSGLQVLQSTVPIGRMTRLDGFIVMDIGTAFVTLSWENIVGTNYFKLATHPLSDRRFSLGVRWQFFD